MRAEQIREIDMKARERFTYMPDGAGDIWRSHADEVLAGSDWSDDCDGLAETVLDLLARAGVPLDRLYRLVVQASSDRSSHMVGAVTDDGGQFWIVGDTFAAEPYHAASMRHTPVDYNRLSEAGARPLWRNDAPWQVAV